MIIGVSGKVGTGKSHVAKYLKKKLGFKVISEEKVRYALIENNSKMKTDMVKTFGDRILHPNGKLNRVKLMKVVFKDQIAYNVFSQLTDMQVGRQIRDMIREQEDNYILDCMSPDHLKITNFFDISVLVTTSKRVALRRLEEDYSRKVIDNIWRFQKDIKRYDYVIDNRGTIRELKNDVDQLILEMFKDMKQSK